MNIKTKFNIGDPVYFARIEGRVDYGEVQAIQVNISSKNEQKKEAYYVNGLRRKDSELFTTVEEATKLLESILATPRELTSIERVEQAMERSKEWEERLKNDFL